MINLIAAALTVLLMLESLFIGYLFDHSLTVSSVCAVIATSVVIWIFR